MATPRKRWPNHAEWARMDCIALAEQGLAALVPVIESELSAAEIVKRTARAILVMKDIRERLCSVRGENDERE